MLLHFPKPMTVEVDDFNKPPTVSCYAIIWIFNVIFYVVNSRNLLAVGMKLLNHRKFDKAALLQPTKFAFITNSNEHREYLTISLGTTRDDAMVSKKCVCSFEELKNKAILRSFCSVWFLQIRIEIFPQVFLQVLSHFSHFLLLTPAKAMIAIHFIANVVNLYNK